MQKPALILASASPRRLALLASIGITPDEIIPANIDETAQKGEAPHLYAKRVAKEKAARIASQKPGAVILAADTVVACGARILPKAEDDKTARQCLKTLSGKRHRVITAVAIHYNNKELLHAEMTVVQFARLSALDIDHYIKSNEWHGKAGGYAIQGLAEGFITRVNGSVSNVIGLPLAKTRLMLAQTGVHAW